LAYQITPKTVVRSGYGISLVQFNRLGGENLLAYDGPNVVDAFIDQVPTQAVCTSIDTAPGDAGPHSPAVVQERYGSLRR
jgi:hypothetical protein